MGRRGGGRRLTGWEMGFFFRSGMDGRMRWDDGRKEGERLMGMDPE
jgi:hypothetical protein